MNGDILIRFFAVGLFSLTFAWVVFSRSARDREGTEDGSQRYLPYISGVILPVFLLTITLLDFFYQGAASAAQDVLAMCFGLFLHISVYYALLLLILPLFRRRFSARACAMLWLIPNYLYILNYKAMELSGPLWVITASEKLDACPSPPTARSGAAARA